MNRHISVIAVAVTVYAEVEMHDIMKFYYIMLTGQWVNSPPRFAR